MEQGVRLVAILFTFPFLHGTCGLPLLKPDNSYTNPFVGFYIFPHGGIVLNPSTIDYSDQPYYRPVSRAKAIKLNEGMKEAAEDLIRSKPDLIIFSTPHGFNLQEKILILDSDNAYGDAGAGVWRDFTASFSIDKELSITLYKELSSVGVPVELLEFGNGFQEVPLLWGEVVPWHFVQKAAKKLRYPLPPVIYIGQPPAVNISYQVNFGRDIAKAAMLNGLFNKRKIGVIISSDLSHFHGNHSAKDRGDGTIVTSPYPHDNIGKQFDNVIVKWAKLDRGPTTKRNSSKLLLGKAKQMENVAGHCGYNGLVMLHGMLEELVNQQWTFQHRLYAYNVPTYFGMLVSRWIEGPVSDNPAPPEEPIYQDPYPNEDENGRIKMYVETPAG